MPGETPFNSGVALKVGQALMGLAEGDWKPPSTDADQHCGNGVVPADDCQVLGVDDSGTSLL